MALPMMMGSCLVSGVALYFTKQATRATTNATSSYTPLSGDPEETESLSSREAFDSGRSVEAVVVDGVVRGSSSVGEGNGTTGRRAEVEVEPPGLWEAAKRKFQWAKAKLKSRAEKVNTASSLVSGDREETGSPGSDILSLSPAAFESGRSVAAVVENPMDTLILEKASDCNIPSPVDGSEATETECTGVADVVHAAEGSEATEAVDGVSAEVDLMAVGNNLATQRNSTRAVDVVHAAEGSEANEGDMLRTGAADVVNAALVDGDVEGNSFAGQVCNVQGVVAEAVKVGEEGGATGRRGQVEHPGLAKRVLRWAKAKLKSGAEWMMLDPCVVRRILMGGGEWVTLDPAVVRRILKRMFLVVVDSVVNHAFKGNTVAFKLCAIMILELKRCM